MAFEVTLVGGVPGFTASQDLRTHKDKFIQLGAVGAFLADQRSILAGGTYVLDNAPNTGQNVALHLGPNVKKVIAGEAITLGRHVQVMSASGLAGQCPVGSLEYRVGIAFSTTAGSGEYCSVKLL